MRVWLSNCVRDRVPEKSDSPPPEQRAVVKPQPDKKELREQAEGAVRQHFQSTADRPADPAHPPRRQKHK